MKMIKTDKSLLRLSTAAMFAGLLVLAGCGGSGPQPTPEEPPTPTPEEQCTADGGIYEDGECKSADDLRQEGADAEGDKRDQEDADEQDAADAAMAQKDAMALRSALSAAISGTYSVSTGEPTGFKDNDAYKAMVVSVMGKPFNKEYTLTNDGYVEISTAGSFVTGFSPSRVKVAVFGTTGEKTHDDFTLVDQDKVFRTSGSYHGVMGTFTCTTPGTDNDGCKSSFNASDDLVLTGTWQFTPGNPSSRVTDGSAVEYGWWTNDIGKASPTAMVYYGPKDMTAYTDYAGGGTATYRGDAVGQYAIHRGVGAANDSGDFTANATLEADFGTDATITGKIDGFKGSDGTDREWSVELQKATVTAGVWEPAGTPNDDTDNEAMTVWTMNGSKGAAGGGWTGAFYGPPDRGTVVPPAAAAGAFSAVHGNIGNMIGSFGTDLDDQ